MQNNFVTPIMLNLQHADTVPQMANAAALIKDHGVPQPRGMTQLSRPSTLNLGSVTTSSSTFTSEHDGSITNTDTRCDIYGCSSETTYVPIYILL